MRKIAITTLKSGFWILTTNFTKQPLITLIFVQVLVLYVHYHNQRHMAS